MLEVEGRDEQVVEVDCEGKRREGKGKIPIYRTNLRAKGEEM